MLPELGAVDAQRAGVELRVDPLFLLLVVVLQCLQRGDLDHQDAHDVQPGHRAHTDVAEAPGGAGGGHGAVGDGDEDQALQEADDRAAQQGVPEAAGEVHHVDLGHVVVRDDRGEGEERQSDRHEAGTQAGGEGVESCLDEAGAGLDVLAELTHVQRVALGREGLVLEHRVHVGGDDDERGGGAHEQGVDVHGEGLHEALLGRVGHLGGGSVVRAGALTGLVGVDAALHAPLDGQADDRAVDGVHAEGAGEDLTEHVGDLVEVHEEHQQRREDVEDRHRRDHVGGEHGDALDAADHDEGQQDDHADGGGPGGDAPGAVHRGGEAVGLHAGQEEAHGEDRGDGEQDAEGEGETGCLVSVGLLEVVGRATAVLTGVRVLLLVDLSQGGLDERRGRAEEGHGPHPEHGAGAAEGDRGGHTTDVAHAHAVGERHHQRLERGGAVGGLLTADELLDHVGKAAQLHEPGADREVQAGEETQGDQGDRPDHPIGGTDHVGETHGTLLGDRGGRGLRGTAMTATAPPCEGDHGFVLLGTVVDTVTGNRVIPVPLQCRYLRPHARGLNRPLS